MYRRKYDYVSLEDNEIPEIHEDVESDVDYNSVDGFKPSPNGLYETAGTTNSSWGFTYRDQNWKSAEVIYKQKQHLNSMGINYLLNVGPDGLGRIPMDSMAILKAVRDMEK